MIKYPYLPEGRTIKYVPADHPYMQLAKSYAQKHSLDKAMPNCSVIVQNGQIVGIGANGSTYHETNGCERVKLKCPTGVGYELCEGCSPKNHGERKAIANLTSDYDPEQPSELYLWGHWWCCQPCWEAMINQGITDVYLLEGSEKLFNRDSPENIIGRQFA